MQEKVFIVSHRKARAPITVTGKTLKSALLKEGLNPAIWKEIESTPESEVIDDGDNQGDGRPEDN